MVLFAPGLAFAESPTKTQPLTSASQLEITATSGDRFISGVYPHLTAYSQSLKSGAFSRKELGECGIGAVIPWAGKLWMMTYAGHRLNGSPHKLYSIDEQMNMTIQPESIGGTPAARMIHVGHKLAADIALLGKGFHDVSMKVNDMHGSPDRSLRKSAWLPHRPVKEV